MSSLAYADPTIFLFALGGPLVVLAVLLVFTWGTVRVGSRRFKSLPAFVEEMNRVLGLPAEREPGHYTELSGLVFRGQLPGGRRAMVTFFAIPAGSTTTTLVIFAVKVGDPLELSIRRENLFHKIGKVLGVTEEVAVGEPAFDDAFLIQTKDARGGAVLAPEARDAIRRLFERFPIRSLDWKGGTLSTDAEVTTIEPSSYPALLELLDLAARTFE